MAVPTCFGIGTYQTTRLPVPPVVNMVIQRSPVPSGTRYVHFTSYLNLYIFHNLVDQILIDLLHPPILTVHQAPIVKAQVRDLPKIGISEYPTSS